MKKYQEIAEESAKGGLMDYNNLPEDFSADDLYILKTMLNQLEEVR